MFEKEYEEYNKTHPPFDPVLDAFMDENRPFPATLLHRFSDLSEKDMENFMRVWDQVSLSRRQSLLEDLEQLIDLDTVLSFAAVGNMALKDPDPHIRSMGIRLLWAEEDLSLGRSFLELLKHDPDSEVRATAANALGYYVYSGELEELPANQLKEIEDALLVAYSSEDTVQVRRLALESLGYSSRPEVPPLLQKAVEEQTSDWQASALFAMGRSADEQWKSIILRSLASPYPNVRTEAARAAGELEIDDAREDLIDLAKNDDDDEVRLASLWSLSQIGGEGVREAIEEAIEASSEDEDVTLLEDALDNLTFTEGSGMFDLLDYSDDPENRIEEELDPAPPKKNHPHKGKGA